MPIKKAGIKDLRQAKKRTERNLQIKKDLKYLLKKTLKAVEENKIDEAKELAKKASKALDKAAQKNVIKKNTAARRKSRLMKKINSTKKK